MNMGDIIVEFGAEPERDVLRGARGAGEYRLQIAAMDSPERRAVTALGLVAQRNTDDLAAGAAGHDADRLRRGHQR